MIQRIIILLFLLFAFTFTGCNKQTSSGITLEFWAMGVEGENVVKLVPEFEKRNPGIKVKVQQIPWTAAHEKLITAFASETLPAVFMVGNTWIPEFVELNAVEPLNLFLKSSGIIKENYFEGIWDANVIDSVVYGIPWYVDTRVLFYRKDILAKAGYNNAPRTWDELYDCAKKIKNNNPENFALLIPTNEWVPYIIFGLQAGSTLLKDNNQYGDFSGREFTRSYNFVMKFFHEKLALTDMTQVINVYQPFAEGYYAMYITGPWNVTEMKKRLPDDIQNKWMTAPLFSYDSLYPGVSLAGGASLVINKMGKNKDAAFKWIEFLSEKGTQIKFYNLVSSLPSLKDAWEDTSLTNNPYMKAFYTQLTRTVPTPKIPEWEQIVFQKIQQCAELTAQNKEKVDVALKNLDTDVNNILEKRRWILAHRNN
jgi:multiple sugar transport system substrate-binding protein